MAPSLEGWPTKAKEAPSSHEVRLAPLDTNQCLREKFLKSKWKQPFRGILTIDVRAMIFRR